MPEDLIAKWPQFRVNPELRDRYEKLLARAADRTSLTKVLNDLLREALDQIESPESSPPAMLTLHRLRAAVGNAPLMGNYDDLAGRMLRVEEMMERLGPAADTLLKVQSTAKKKKAARKRAA